MQGVIVGTSRGQEWLLPWWWMHYRLHNSYPVTFVDFGDLTSDAAEWCRQRGDLIKLDLSDGFMAKKDAVSHRDAAIWEAMHRNVWQMRFTWYKKPLSLIRTPYKRTLWLDLDTQIRGSLRSLFAIPLGDGGIGVSAEPEWSQQLNLSRGIIAEGQTMFNAGVVIFERDSQIIQEWAKQTITRNHLFCSDQQLLANILFTEKRSFAVLSSVFNWTVDRPINPDAVIVHWWGNMSKETIKKQIFFLNKSLNYNLTLKDKTGIHGESLMMIF